MFAFIKEWWREFEVWCEARELREQLVAKGALRQVELLDNRKRGLMPYHIDANFLEWLLNVERDLRHPNVDTLYGTWVRYG